MPQSKKDKDKDSHQEEVNALKAELKRLKTKEDTNNFQETKIFCSNCNAEVRLGSKFCSKCGTVIENKSSNKKPSKDRVSSAKASTVSDSVEISDLKNLNYEKNQEISYQNYSFFTGATATIIVHF